MSLSFCIITGGKRPDLIRTVITSIRAQKIPAYEIIVAGKHHAEPGIVYVEAEEAAAHGRLSEMRNKAVALTRYENIVILDDDNVYMTGGGGWVMKDYVARDVKWDENRAYYQEEDVDFSRRCQAEGFRISHNHRMLVYHADPTYTCIGRLVARRKDGRSQAWAVQAFSRLTFWQIMNSLRRMRKQDEHAEIADFVRLGTLQGPHKWLFSLVWRRVVSKMGGNLPGARWYPTGDPDYLSALDEYRQR